ncbi:T-complex protein 1 subunit alpha-like [Helianthus annuus]|uniref:T-complex protein 1 subunit alpha-like n=1 Tax=Helianthus annuus TaxID=4232 RepID=UPI000B900E7A|nr:T-complex protein 1 subunit alpha-like [Helianthus annuus]
MVINHLDKLFVTSDTATIVNELEVQHPAANILVLAGKAQQEEIGDGANLVVSFARELFQSAEEVIRMGLHPCDIIIGYTKAINKKRIRLGFRERIRFRLCLGRVCLVVACLAEKKGVENNTRNMEAAVEWWDEEKLVALDNIQVHPYAGLGDSGPLARCFANFAKTDWSDPMGCLGCWETLLGSFKKYEENCIKSEVESERNDLKSDVESGYL